MNQRIAIFSVLIVAVSFLAPDYTVKVIGNVIRNCLFLNKRFEKPKENLFTKGELNLYNGIKKPELYLAVLGNIFDVTKGAKHYGPNQQYNVFVGRDASRNFVNGKFNPEDISEEVGDFTNDELRSLNHWIKFYQKEYKLVGKLIGKYYNDKGEPTHYGKEVSKMIKNAEEEKENDKEELTKYPPCNVAWDAEVGTKFWCSDKSGGIVREWVGVPRQFYEVNSKSYRCACIHEGEVEKLGNIKEYIGCGKRSDTCFVET